VSNEKEKPVFDEQNLAKLLEAAFVVQEHNRKLLALGLRIRRQDLPAEPAQSITAPADETPKTSQSTPAANDNYALNLAQIVQTQQQIQVRRLELDEAIALVAERATGIARASGAAIGLLDGGKISYKAAHGLMTLPAGSEIPAEKALCAACVRSSRIIRCEDVDSEPLLDPEECRRRGIRSLIAVPIYSMGGIAGGLELYYDRTHAFTEQDVHTCQLMAALVTEVLVRSDQFAWKESSSNERAVMLEALEKLKFNLAALLGAPKDSATETAVTATAAPAFSCRKCGRALLGEEQFCGHCGSPRSGDYEPPTMQTKVASLWQMQQETEDEGSPAPANGASVLSPTPVSFNESLPDKPLVDSIKEEMPELFAVLELGIEKAPSVETPVSATGAGVKDAVEPHLAFPLQTGDESEDEDDSRPDTKLARPEPAAHWSSAATAREFLERLAAARPHGALTSFWKRRRGDFYLAIAVILVACVIRWGIWTRHSVIATGSPARVAAQRNPKPAPDAELSLFDRMLISLGLAEAPEPPEYKGNPETQVWVDLHTALYYCPGTDLYGKTPKGKFTTQRDAQLDQFEPAYRKACD
jgi:GAF domain-containing protein